MLGSVKRLNMIRAFVFILFIDYVSKFGQKIPCLSRVCSDTDTIFFLDIFDKIIRIYGYILKTSFRSCSQWQKVCFSQFQGENSQFKKQKYHHFVTLYHNKLYFLNA